VHTCCLIDPLARQHSPRPFSASHKRESQRIDFILVSSGVHSSVVSSGCQSFYSTMHSDHRAYFIDFSSKELFANKGHEIAPPFITMLCLQYPWVVKIYWAALHAKLTERKVIEKLDVLMATTASNQWTSKHTTQYQLLDMIISQAMLQVEREICTNH
jgi:hypothetical protein